MIKYDWVGLWVFLKELLAIHLAFWYNQSPDLIKKNTDIGVHSRFSHAGNQLHTDTHTHTDTHAHTHTLFLSPQSNKYQGGEWPKNDLFGDSHVHKGSNSEPVSSSFVYLPSTLAKHNSYF